MKAKKFLALLLTVVMLFGMMPTTMLTVSATEEVEAQEYPKDAEYDFTVSGSTISFLDKDGVLLTEEKGWTEGEAVVETWYVFMYRTTKNNLKLGYSPEGTLFLPHKVYEGNTADLLYVKNNNMFRVTATKDAVQTFDGSQILKTISLKATNGTVTLANAPVYAETPFGFVYMGATDENGTFSVNSTTGEFKLWISSNAGYILNKSVTITNSTTEISFAEEITNAVEIDVTARQETYSTAPGYVVALGKPNETESVNMLTTSYVNPANTVKVTPGTYSVACVIYLEDQNDSYSTSEYGGLWVDLAENTAITQKTTFDFAIADFEGKYAIREEYKLDAYGVDDLMAYKVYAEHAKGYVIPGTADYVDYLTGSVTVTVGENQYPYTFGWGDFSMLYDANVYKKGDENTIIQTWESSDWEFSLSTDFFGETENEYVVKYFPKWDSMTFPELFPDGVWYSTTFKTKPLSSNGVTYKMFESSEYFHSVYYIDENGEQRTASYDYRDEKYYYYVPTSVKNGDYLFGFYNGYDKIEYGIIPVSDELFTNGYQHTAHTDFSAVNFEVKSGDTVLDCAVQFGITIEVGEQKFSIDGFEMGTMIPYGEYIISANASCEVYDEETGALLNNTLVTYLKNQTLSEETHTFTIDYSTFKSFTIDASAFFPEDYWAMDDYKKQIAFHYADGSVTYVDWIAAPIKLYCATLPEYATGEMYYYALEEMTPFSPYVSLEKFDIEDGKTYKFDFKPTAIEITGSTTFESNENTVLTYKVTDGFGNVLNDMWNLLNEWGVHTPLRSKEYPFRDSEGNPVNHQYTVDVYLRAKGETEYEKMSFTDFTKADLGMLEIGEYEGYVEINFDTYLDEYLVEYPMEKGVYYDEYWGEFISVYDNVARVLSGVLRDEFSFTVIEQTHTCDFGDWVDDEVTETHTRTCKDPECGKTETENHGWDNGVQNGTPTCTEGATITYTCTGCGKTKTEDVDNLGHDWTDWTDDGENSPTDTHSRTCKRNCGVAAETESHGWSRWTPVDDDTHKKTCSGCKGTRTATHNWGDGVVSQEPTEFEEGLRTYTCGDCAHTKGEPIPKLDHDLTFVPAKDAKCTEDGNIAHYYCSGCQGYYSDEAGANELERSDVIIPALDHDWSDWAYDSVDSHTRYCKRNCGVEEEFGGHEWDEWTVYDDNTHRLTCPICHGYQEGGHDWDNGVETKSPTCNETGILTYTCGTCGHTKTEDIPKTEHSFTDWAPNGDENHKRECTSNTCDAFETLPHEWDDGEITTNPTCTEKGVKTYTCLTCSHTKTEDLPMIDHEWTDWSDNKNGTHTRSCRCNASETKDCTYDAGVVTTEPTHTDKGVKTFTCTVCGHTYTEDIPVLTDHVWGEWIIHKLDEANTHIRYCICDESQTAPHNFDEGKVTTEATHTSKGVKTFTCTDGCGYSYTEEIPTTPEHSWTDWEENGDGTHSRYCRCNASETKDCTYDAGVVTTEPTHTSKGVKTFTCTVCGHTYTEDIPETTEHEWTDWSDNGNGTHTRSCRCNANETKDCTYDAGVVTKEPTHYEEGVKTFTCTVCGCKKTESIAKTTTHEWSDWAKKDDKTHIRECKCGEVETKEHNFDAGVVTKEATHLETGVKKFTCSDCGFVREDTIAKTTEHTFGAWQCEATVVGKHYRECACGEREIGDCTWDDGVITTEPTYESTGTKTYTCTACGGTKIETLDMLVKAEEIVSPDNSGVKITTPEGSNAVLNENTVLQVEEVKDEISEDVKANVVEVVGGNDSAEFLASYDISLILDGATVQPGGKVEVTLPAPENAGDFDTLQVVYIDDEGNVTPCETRVNADGTVTFVTDHFSHYAIVGVQNSSPVVWILISAISVALIAGAVVAVLVIKKKKGIA